MLQCVPSWCWSPRFLCSRTHFMHLWGPWMPALLLLVSTCFWCNSNIASPYCILHWCVKILSRDLMLYIADENGKYYCGMRVLSCTCCDGTYRDLMLYITDENGKYNCGMRVLSCCDGTYHDLMLYLADENGKYYCGMRVLSCTCCDGTYHDLMLYIADENGKYYCGMRVLSCTCCDGTYHDLMLYIADENGKYYCGMRVLWWNVSWSYVVHCRWEWEVLLWNESAVMHLLWWNLWTKQL